MDCTSGGDRCVQRLGGPVMSLLEKCVLVLCVMVMTDLGVTANTVVWAPTRAPTSDITCWTCNNKMNNEECNNWAPDLKCPINHTVCQTVHRFRSSGLLSVHVSKKCVHTSTCTLQHVGCSHDSLTGQQECVSCCDYSYCNQEVAYNNTSALMLSSLSYTTPSSARAAQPLYTVVVLLVSVSCVVWCDWFRTLHVPGLVFRS